MLTRKEYLASPDNLHNEYYSQFITPSIISFVRQIIKGSRQSKWQDIPLNEWDRYYNITPEYINRKLWIECENSVLPTIDNRFFWSYSSNVCVLKAAARMIEETE